MIRCPKGHALKCLGKRTNGWACDARETSRVDANTDLMDSTKVPIGLIGDAISATTICVVCALLQEEDKFSWSVYVYVFVVTFL